MKKRKVKSNAKTKSRKPARRAKTRSSRTRKTNKKNAKHIKKIRRSKKRSSARANPKRKNPKKVKSSKLARRSTRDPKQKSNSKSVLRSYKNVKSSVTGERTTLTIYRTRIAPRDQIDLADMFQRDVGQIYLVLLKYFNKIYKKMKQQDAFSIKVEYSEGESGLSDYISSSLTSWDDMPRMLEDDILELAELLVERAEIYLDRKFATEMKLKQVYVTTRNIKK